MLKDKLDSLQERLRLSNILPKYKVDKRIFRVALLLIVLYCVFAWYSVGFVNVNKVYAYASCESDLMGACRNPFFDMCNINGSDYGNNKICDSLDSSYYEYEFMLVGESIGEKPPSVLVNSFAFFWFVFIGAFVVNHLVYNRKYKI